MARLATSLAAFRDGASRVRRAPAILLGTYCALLLITGPAAWLVHQTVAEQLGDSTLAEAVAGGGQLEWLREFRAGAAGLASDVASSTAGFAAVLRNASDLLDRAAADQPARPASYPSWLLVLVWWLVGTFLSGGILDRYARMRPLHAQGFFGACGTMFPRLVRLNLMVIAVYWAVIGGYGLGARAIYAWSTDDLASERAQFAWAFSLFLPGLVLFAIVTIVADCARVRMVVEDRRSALFALGAGARFARREAWPLAVLYTLIGILLLVLMALYALVAPGAGSSVGWARAGLAIGTVYVLGRIFLKLVTYASTTALFQSALAHAGYAAQPLPVWPESPAIETLGPASDR